MWILTPITLGVMILATRGSKINGRDILKSKIGVRYLHGKILFYVIPYNYNFKPSNPSGVSNACMIGEGVSPAWAVDIREVLFIMFTGICSILLIYKGEYQYAKELLLVLGGYVFGRTIPGGVPRPQPAKA